MAEQDISIGLTRDRCYQSHGRPPRTAHLAQSSNHSTNSSSVSGSSSTTQGVILTPSEYEQYLRLTQATKSSSIASIAQTNNVSTCLTHSFAPWILDTGASNHISSNKDFFPSLTFPSSLPTITLTNGSQTIAKGISSACPLPSLPLTSVLYVPDFPFNLMSISKLTLDLHCVITFAHNSITLQDRSTGLASLFHCLHFHDSSSPPPQSSRSPKFQKLVPHFSSLSSLE